MPVRVHIQILLTILALHKSTPAHECDKESRYTICTTETRSELKIMIEFILGYSSVALSCLRKMCKHCFQALQQKSSLHGGHYPSHYLKRASILTNYCQSVHRHACRPKLWCHAFCWEFPDTIMNISLVCRRSEWGRERLVTIAMFMWQARRFH